MRNLNFNSFNPMELLPIPLFIHVRVLDIVDIVIVAFLLYQIYLLIRGTAAIKIFSGIVLLYFIWLVVKALNMELLGSILGQVIGVGVIAIIIVFQQEIRKFLLLLGSRYTTKGKSALESFLLGTDQNEVSQTNLDAIVKACKNLSETKTGALIAITRNSELEVYSQTGDIINAELSSRLLENIFFKNSPLHDGAAIIKGNKIHAARCVLPISENLNLPPNFGMRHKSALGLTEVTDALVIVVSEETGKISLADNGSIDYGISLTDLKDKLEQKLQAKR